VEIGQTKGIGGDGSVSGLPTNRPERILEL
jgi:hypothetical protein